MITTKVYKEALEVEKVQAVKKRTNSPEVLKKASETFYEKDKNLKTAITLNGKNAKKVKERFNSLKPHGFNNAEFMNILLDLYKKDWDYFYSKENQY